ncbi:MAG: sigma-70 family RNA polymerase sigma factor [Verrucomicrobia bacterium]|nr:sigma-70 family RNA polymerase sigma factor [Verrucomicrobiota bacterium]
MASLLPVIPHDDNPLNTRASLLGRLKDWEDERSWRDFFETYWRLIYGTARKGGLSDAESQEVVQETVIAVAKKMKEFKYDPAVGSFKGWLKLITRRRIADQYRKRKPQEIGLADTDTADGGARAMDRLPDAAGDIVNAAWEADWRQSLLDRAMELVRTQVSPRQYQIFDLYVLRQWPASQVAASLDISTAQVHLAKHRVQAQIKKEARRLERTFL